MKRTVLLLVLGAALGCGDNGNDNAGGGPGTGGSAGMGGGGSGGEPQTFSADPPLVVGGERPAPVVIPRDYDPTTAHPLVVVLHGFGPLTGVIQSSFLGITDMVEPKDLVLVLPDGTLNEDGDRFWNGASFCCDPDQRVDDVSYIRGLIAEAKGLYNIDAKRVYLIGHSNGGFMSFRMACEASDVITAIASLAGSTFADEADCAPATLPVSVLAIHGTADEAIAYDGVEGVYPSAVETVETFASAAGCDTSAPTPLGSVDFLSDLPGDETDRVAYTTGCDEGVDAALWTIQDGPHIPFFDQSGDTVFADFVTDWLLDHSR